MLCPAARVLPRGVVPAWVRLLSAGTSGPPGVPFMLADIGEGISEVEVLHWHVQAGDRVRQFDPLVEVQSDKATVEITSRYDGVVATLGYDVGDMAAVGTPLCFIRTEQAPLPTAVANGGSGKVESAADVGESTIPCDMQLPRTEASDQMLKAAPGGNGEALAVPAVRRLAKEHGIDISSIVGTGKDGRVTKDDIYRYINEPQTDGDRPAVVEEPVESAETWVTRGRQADAVAPLVGRTEKIRGLRRAMVKSMAASALIPQLGLGEEICMDALYALRKDLKPVVEANGVRLTYLPFFVKAASLALADFPLLNASVDEACENITYHDTHNISVAMDTSHGLVVPNVKHVERLSIVGIAREIGRLAAEATQSPPRFSQEDLAGGTFALSNIGSIGGTYTSPVVMPPQVAIGAIGRMRTTVVPRENERARTDGTTLDEDEWTFDVGRVVHVSWSADHRVVDGATMANFSNAWKRYVEKPHLMLMHLK